MNYNFVSEFLDCYYRNNKTGGQKNLRCFPTCNEYGHIAAGFCGRPVVLDVFDCKVAPSRLSFWGQFVEEVAHMEDEPKVMIETDAFALQRTREYPTRPWVAGVVVKHPTVTNAVRVTFNIQLLGWHYDWVSAKSKCELLHQFAVSVFTREENTLGGGTRKLCRIGTLRSAPFNVYSRRRKRLANNKTTGAKKTDPCPRREKVEQPVAQDCPLQTPAKHKATVSLSHLHDTHVSGPHHNQLHLPTQANHQSTRHPTVDQHPAKFTELDLGDIDVLQLLDFEQDNTQSGLADAYDTSTNHLHSPPSHHETSISNDDTLPTNQRQHVYDDDLLQPDTNVHNAVDTNDSRGDVRRTVQVFGGVLGPRRGRYYGMPYRCGTRPPRRMNGLLVRIPDARVPQGRRLGVVGSVQTNAQAPQSRFPFNRQPPHQYDSKLGLFGTMQASPAVTYKFEASKTSKKRSLRGLPQGCVDIASNIDRISRVTSRLFGVLMMSTGQDEAEKGSANKRVRERQNEDVPRDEDTEGLRCRGIPEMAIEFNMDSVLELLGRPIQIGERQKFTRFCEEIAMHFSSFLLEERTVTDDYTLFFKEWAMKMPMVHLDINIGLWQELIAKTVHPSTSPLKLSLRRLVIEFHDIWERHLTMFLENCYGMKIEDLELAMDLAVKAGIVRSFPRDSPSDHLVAAKDPSWDIAGPFVSQDEELEHFMSTQRMYKWFVKIQRRLESEGFMNNDHHNLKQGDADDAVRPADLSVATTNTLDPIFDINGTWVKTSEGDVAERPFARVLATVFGSRFSKFFCSVMESMFTRVSIRITPEYIEYLGERKLLSMPRQRNYFGGVSRKFNYEIPLPFAANLTNHTYQSWLYRTPEGQPRIVTLISSKLPGSLGKFNVKALRQTVIVPGAMEMVVQNDLWLFRNCPVPEHLFGLGMDVEAMRNSESFMGTSRIHFIKVANDTLGSEDAESPKATKVGGWFNSVPW